MYIINERDDDLLTMKEVEKLVTLKKSTIYEMIKRKEFPSQHKIGVHAARWLRGEINEWKQQRTAS
ncbi:MAG: helix-turn-helix transcriptional regulator [Providencia rustigianii]|uniref:helix-turn-helix transcriptional regulator n=1 Tax=Providencia rustigianii TaxID=158850 RepID=UPI003F3D5A2B